MDNHISIMNTLKSSQTNMNEAETKAEYIDPKIKQSGWTEDFI